MLSTVSSQGTCLPPGQFHHGRRQPVPAVEQVEFERHPVLAIPAIVADNRGIDPELEIVWGNVIDVFLDDDFHQEDDHHVAGGLKQPFVIPRGVFLRQLARNAIVLAQEQRVEHRETGLRVGSIAAEGE